MKALKNIVFDFNITFPNNIVLFNQNGIKSVHFWRIASLSVRNLIISTEVNPAVSIRSKSLKSEFIQEMEDEALVIADWARSLGLSVSNKLFYFLHGKKLN